MFQIKNIIYNDNIEKYVFFDSINTNNISTGEHFIASLHLLEYHLINWYVEFCLISIIVSNDIM